MNRIIVFHGYASNDARLTALCAAVKEIFPNGEYRVNFYSTAHKDQEIEKSCKSQSVSCPIDIFFDQTHPTQQRSARQGMLRNCLQKFSLSFHYPTGIEQYKEEKTKIEKRNASQKAAREQLANSKNARKTSNGYIQRTAA